MGLAKQLVETHTFSMRGTPDFMAPEVIKISGHNEAADWWSFGVLIYELMRGNPPFQHCCPIETMKKARQNPVPNGGMDERHTTSGHAETI